MALYPTSDTTIPRPDLGATAWEAMVDSSEFVGLQVMPIFRVPQHSADFPVIPVEAMFQLIDTLRGITGAYNESDYPFEFGFYRTEDRGLVARLDDRMVKIYSSLFAYEMVVTKLKMADILRALEYIISRVIFNTTNFTVHNVTTEWSTLATCTPQSDVNTAKKALEALGVPANALIMAKSVYENLTMCTDAKNWVVNMFGEQFKDGRVSTEHLQRYFGLPHIIAGGARYNSAKKGQSASLTEVWDDEYCMVGRIAESPAEDITNPCLGRTMLWNEGATDDLIVEEYVDDDKRAKKIRVRHDAKPTLLASIDSSGTEKSGISKRCGYLLGNISA